jgi:putative phosphoesterase
MHIAVLSDTHGHMANTSAAISRIRREGVEAVLHCGDIGSPAIVPLFSEWPTHFVFGNVDDDQDELAEAIRAAGLTCHDRFGSILLEGVRIALLHSDDRSRFETAIVSGEFDLVCYGHTHVAEHHCVGRTVVLNPGALYRAVPHTFAIVELPSLSIRQIALD